MATASTAILALGFVVAVAADSLPGDNGDKPLLDLQLRTELNLSPILAWILLVLAVVGAVLFALGLREARPREEQRRRNILGAVIGLVIFVIVFRWVRPAAESLLEEGSSLTDSATDPIAEGRAGTASGWLFSLLLAAVVAAALTRIGLSINTAGSPFQMNQSADAPEPQRPEVLEPAVYSLGDDPRSRILRAYQEFEAGLAAAGQPRAKTETTGRHARRAGESLDLDPDLVGGLVAHHATARYGNSEPAESEAETAEQFSSHLREGIRE